MFGRLVAALLLVLVPAVAQAQTTNPRLTANANGVRDAGTSRELGLRRIDIAVAVRGAVAEAIVTATFENPGKEPLEGDFRFVLPEGAVVTGYALDVGGRLIDGVLVDQPRAKAVYEQQVRGSVDPGLAEVSPAGEFRTRVFPILPDKGRTIRLRFVAPLYAAGASDETWRLALSTSPREGWSIAVRASGDLPAPMLAWPGRDSGPMAREGDDWVARGEGTALGGALTIARPAFAALVSRNALGEASIQLSGALAPSKADRADRVRVYWDRSRARLDDDHAGELALLRRTLVALGARTIEVVTFNSSGAERRTLANAGAAVTLLERVKYRGATSFAALAGEAGSVDRCLLFSGGRAAVDRAAAFTARCRLDAVTSAGDADMGWLRRTAARHGGGAFALGKDASLVERALTGGGEGVTGVFDEAGAPLPFVAIPSRAGRWTVVARAPGKGGVVVRAGTSEARIALPAGVGAFDGEGVLLALDALGGLDAPERRADYVALSRRYGVASPSLSFLVLEAPGDYVNADIAPPPGYPEEQLAQYREQRARADEEAAEARRERADEVATMWAEQVEWWEKRFDPNARVPKREREAASAPLPPPPPPPSPPSPSPVTVMPEPTPAPDEDTGVVVTGMRASVSQSLNIKRNSASIVAEDIGSFPDSQPATQIAIEAWQPDRPYIKAFNAAPAAFDRVFAEQEAKNGSLPAFYFDTAEWLRRHGRAGEASEMVLAALDLPVANSATLGIVAARLQRYGDLDRAVELRERQAVLEPDRPQPKRLLALALARRAALRPAGARADLERAVALLAEIALTPWDGDWDGVELIALIEANALIPKLRALGGKTELDPRLVKLLDVDLRIVVDWDTDATDLDLWVDEPNGERAIYSNPRTVIGGHLSNDMTSGYGPEEYLLRRAPRGTYTIRADVYASDRIDPNGPSVITARLIRDFGRPTEHEESVDIELTSDEDGEKLIGRLVVGGRKK